jgi:hypothetical protein
MKVQKFTNIPNSIQKLSNHLLSEAEKQIPFLAKTWEGEQPISKDDVEIGQTGIAATSDTGQSQERYGVKCCRVSCLAKVKMKTKTLIKGIISN